MHTFSGCDTVSSLYRIGKKTAGCLEIFTKFNNSVWLPFSDSRGNNTDDDTKEIGCTAVLYNLFSAASKQLISHRNIKIFHLSNARMFISPFGKYLGTSAKSKAVSSKSCRFGLAGHA